jgi:hypothetical protein
MHVWNHSWQAAALWLPARGQQLICGGQAKQCRFQAAATLDAQHLLRSFPRQNVMNMRAGITTSCRHSTSAGAEAPQQHTSTHLLRRCADDLPPRQRVIRARVGQRPHQVRQLCCRQAAC